MKKISLIQRFLGLFSESFLKMCSEFALILAKPLFRNLSINRNKHLNLLLKVLKQTDFIILDDMLTPPDMLTLQVGLNINTEQVVTVWPLKACPNETTGSSSHQD